MVGEFVAKVEEGAPGVIEENADGLAGAEFQEKRDAFVDGIGGILPSEGIGVPHGVALAGAVERAGLVAKAKEVGVLILALIDAEVIAIPSDGLGVLLDDLA